MSCPKCFRPKVHCSCGHIMQQRLEEQISGNERTVNLCFDRILELEKSITKFYKEVLGRLNLLGYKLSLFNHVDTLDDFHYTRGVIAELTQVKQAWIDMMGKEFIDSVEKQFQEEIKLEEEALEELEDGE